MFSNETDKLEILLGDELQFQGGIERQREL